MNGVVRIEKKNSKMIEANHLEGEKERNQALGRLEQVTLGQIKGNPHVPTTKLRRVQCITIGTNVY